MITKVSQAKVIASAFFKTLRGQEADELISHEQLDYRREKCSKCTFNSKNMPKEKLHLFAGTREKLIGDFCSICGCQIKEKTLSPSEECAKVERGQAPEWYRLAVLTSQYNEDFVNLSPELINIDASPTEYEVLVHDISENIKFKVGIKAKSPINQVNYVRAGCSCINVSGYTLTDNFIELPVKVDVSKFNKGVFHKWIYVKYTTCDHVEHILQIKVKGLLL